MTSLKKLVSFLIVFMVLGIAALFLLVKGKPTTEETQPLSGVTVQNLGKIIIDQPTGTLIFEKKDTRWEMIQPTQDTTDKDVIDRFLKSLENFTVGSVISESKDRYSQFEIQDASATRLRIFVGGSETPVLDAYVGKEGTAYNTSFFRFANQVPVRIASDLSSWELKRPPSDYRLRKVLPANFKEAAHFKVKSGKIEVSVAKSSNTWVNEKNQKTVPNEWVQTLSSRLEVWTATSFGGYEKPEVTGVLKPFMEAEVQTSSGTVSAVIGNPRQFGTAKPVERYAKTEGRDAVLIVTQQVVDDTLNHLKTFPK